MVDGLMNIKERFSHIQMNIKTSKLKIYSNFPACFDYNMTSLECWRLRTFNSLCIKLCINKLLHLNNYFPWGLCICLAANFYGFLNPKLLLYHRNNLIKCILNLLSDTYHILYSQLLIKISGLYIFIWMKKRRSSLQP